MSDDASRPTPLGWTRKPPIHEAADHRQARFVTNDEAVSATLDCYDGQRGLTVVFYGEGLELHLDELDSGSCQMEFKLGDNRVGLVLTRASVRELMAVFSNAAEEFTEAKLAQL